jgi:hypothetical protein
MLNAVFVAATVGPIVGGLVAGWRLARSKANDVAPWRRRLAFWGLITNWLPIGVVVLQIVLLMVNMNYAFLGFFSMSGVFISGLVFAVFTVVAGSCSPQGIRLPLTLSGALACAFWLILPSGVGFL